MSKFYERAPSEISEQVQSEYNSIVPTKVFEYMTSDRVEGDSDKRKFNPGKFIDTVDMVIQDLMHEKGRGDDTEVTGMWDHWIVENVIHHGNEFGFKGLERLNGVVNYHYDKLVTQYEAGVCGDDQLNALDKLDKIVKFGLALKNTEE